MKITIRNTILTTVILGGIYGFLDNMDFSSSYAVVYSFGSFIGGALSCLILSLFLGFGTHLIGVVLEKIGILRIQQEEVSNLENQILDSELAKNESHAVNKISLGWKYTFYWSFVIFGLFMMKVMSGV